MVTIKPLVTGTADFIGLNYYTSKIVRQAKEHNFDNKTFLEDIPELNVILESDPSWKKTCAYNLDVSIYICITISAKQTVRVCKKYCSIAS